MCNKCNKTTPCNCGDIKFEGCSTSLDMLCTYYTGQTLDTLGITEGMNGKEILIKINEYVKKVLLNLEVSPTVIDSVGNGVAVYKGLSTNFIEEFKSLVGVGINIQATEDLVTFNLDEEYLQDIIQNIVNNTTADNNIEFKFSPVSINPGTPDTKPEIWNTDTSNNDVFMAIKETISGDEGAWKIVKTKGNSGKDGEDGKDGTDGTDGTSANTSFTANVFIKSELQPFTPLGGTFSDSIPSGWYDGIPPSSSAPGPVWMSTRIFSSDGKVPQQPTWTVPQKVVDTSTMNYEWSSVFQNPGNPGTNPTNWHDPGTEDDIWMAMQRTDNGRVLPWVVIRIKGETGDPGDPGQPGAPGIPGSGLTVSNSNPLQSIAVGSDGILQGVRIYDVSISVLKNTTELIATENLSPARDEFRIELPTSPLNGITVSKLSPSTLRYTVANNTVFSTNSVTSSIKIYLNSGELSSTFVLTPVRSAEDATSLTLNTSSTVVKFDAFGTVITPLTIDLQAVKQNYDETVTWSSVPAGIVSGTGNSKFITTSTMFSGGPSVKIIIQTPNGLKDEVTIVRVNDGTPGAPGAPGTPGDPGDPGDPGAPGINGTSGPSPRLLEFVVNGVYQNGGDYIDYAYYRTTDTATEGWYTVKLPVGNPPGTIIYKNYLGGVPNSADFDKAPFTKEMSFGTVIAEQANLAGFLFRNQILSSQAGYTTASCHPQPATEKKNLNLDGLTGTVSFGDRMIQNKEGILLKDDCGVRRMAFQWVSGIPVLKFYASDGVTVTWEAGQGGYIPYAVETRAPSFIVVQLNSNIRSVNKPVNTQTSFNLIKPKYCYTNDGSGNQYSIKPTLEAEKPFMFDKGVTIDGVYPPQDLIDNGKVYIQANRNSSLLQDGWYATYMGIADYEGVEVPTCNWHKYEGGKFIEEFNLTYSNASLNSVRQC